MPTPIHLRYLVLIAAGLALVGAPDTSLAQVREWFDAEVRDADRELLPPNVALHWDREDFVAARRRSSQNAQESDAAPIRQSHDLRWRGTGRWRYDTTYGPNASAIEIEYVDQAMTEGAAWRLSNIQLDVLDAKNQPPEINVASEESGFSAAVQLMLGGGLAFIPRYQLTLGQVESDGRAWRVVGTNDDYGLAIEFRGRWSETDHRGFVDSIRTIKSPYAGHLSYAFEDYRFNEALGQFVASSVTVTDGVGALDSRYMFQSAQRESPERFDEVTRVPDVVGSDPIRGPVTVARMEDHRKSGGMHAQVREADGNWLQVSLPSAGSSTGGSQAIRWIGICGSAVVIGVIVLLRLRRSAGG